jgi:hypothetical protein
MVDKLAFEGVVDRLDELADLLELRLAVPLLPALERRPVRGRARTPPTARA